MHCVAASFSKRIQSVPHSTLPKIILMVMLMNQINSLPKMPSRSTSNIFLVMSVIIGAMSGALGSVVLFDFVAAILTSVALLSIKRPTAARITFFALAAGLISTVLAVVCRCFLVRGFDPIALTAAAYALISLAIALCVLKLRGRSFTVMLSGIIMFAFWVIALLCVIYMQYGRLDLSVFADIENKLRVFLVENLETYMSMLSQNGATVPFSSVEIEETVNSTLQSYKLLLPAVMFDLAMLVTFVITGIFRRIMLGYYFGRRNLSDWLVKVSRTTAGVYLISLAAYMIISLFAVFTDASWVTITTAALDNIILLTLPGCLCIGLREVATSFKQRRPQFIFSIVMLIMIGCCNPLFLLFYVGFTGAFQIIFASRIIRISNMRQ